MNKLINYLSLTISQFFRKPEVRREICQIASSCSGGGGGLTEVSTTNSADIAFTGDGTSGNPLSATITGGVIQTASNGLYVDGTEVKLGTVLAKEEGFITENVFIVGGNNQTLDVFGVTITPSNRNVSLYANDTANSDQGGRFFIQPGASNLNVFEPAGSLTVDIQSNNFSIEGTGAGFPGATYIADYSASYTDRSLVDKAFVDLRVPAPPTTGTFILQSVDGVVNWVSQ